MKKLKIILIFLVIFTLLAAFVSNISSAFTTPIILLLASFKFIGVSFYLMDLKEAHPFWKGIVLLYLFVFVAIILISMS